MISDASKQVSSDPKITLGELPIGARNRGLFWLWSSTRNIIWLDLLVDSSLIDKSQRSINEIRWFYPISNASNYCSSEGPPNNIIIWLQEYTAGNRPVVVFFDRLISKFGRVRLKCKVHRKRACLRPFSNRPFAIADVIEVVSLKLFRHDMDHMCWYASQRYSRMKVLRLCAISRVTSVKVRILHENKKPQRSITKAALTTAICSIIWASIESHVGEEKKNTKKRGISWGVGICTPKVRERARPTSE